MKRQILVWGKYSALTAFAATVGFGAVQILQVAGILAYPLDAFRIYGFSLAIAPAFLLAILALHYTVIEDRRFWTHAALLFTGLYVGYVVLMYGVQLATVIPASLVDSSDTLLTVKPHSFFWTVDALGYICMGIATYMASLALRGDRAVLWLRRFLLANGLAIPLISVAYFYPNFSNRLLLIGAPWLLTASGSMLLLSLYFKRLSNKIR